MGKYYLSTLFVVLIGALFLMGYYVFIIKDEFAVFAAFMALGFAGLFLIGTLFEWLKKY